MKLLIIIGLCMILINGCRDDIDNSFELTEDTWMLNYRRGDLYCYQKRNISVLCDCDIFIFLDGHIEKRNCYCWAEPVMHYECINVTGGKA